MISVYYGISVVKNLPNSQCISVTKYLFPTESIAPYLFFTIVFSKLLSGEGGWSKSLVSSAGKSLLITKFFKKIPNLPRAILTFHGHFFLICHGQLSSFTGNFWPNLPRATLRVSRATVEILICHGQLSSFTGTFL